MMPTIPSQIRRAIPDEAPLFNALAGRSALYWGYEPECLEGEAQALLVTAEFIADSPVYVLEEGGQVVGYYGLAGEPPAMIFDKLFVELELIGTGRGKLLWQHAVATAQDLRARVLTFAAGRNAVPFYRAMGAEWVEAVKTSRPNWDLQMFRFPVSSIDAVGR